MPERGSNGVALPPTLRRVITASLLIAVVATLDAAGGMLGFWSVAGEQRTVILASEFALLLCLMACSLVIRHWVYTHSTNVVHRMVAWLSVASLALCFAGDIVNFNLPGTFFRHGEVVKHDYLIDSIWFFAPGYVLLLAAVLGYSGKRQVHKRITGALLIAGGLVAGIVCLKTAHPHSGLYILALGITYAVLMGAIAASSVVLFMACGGPKAGVAVWVVCLGLLLAAAADAVIAEFWLYGNAGDGFFPLVRYVNWMLYIASQCLIIQLPWVVALQDRMGALASPTMLAMPGEHAPDQPPQF